MSWTEERVETLKELWATGLSASQIARQMGGITRNAVIGKVHRLGLAARAPRQAKRTAPAQAPQLAVPTKVTRFTNEASEISREDLHASSPQATREATHNSPVDTPAGEEINAQSTAETPQGARVGVPAPTVLTLTERVCKWPIGNPGEKDFHFCGLKAAGAGIPYCDYHFRIAYQPVERRRRSQHTD
ncbi:MAG: GcrA family cell cycle regulator [Parvularculales bacterium]